MRAEWRRGDDSQHENRLERVPGEGSVWRHMPRVSRLSYTRCGQRQFMSSPNVRALSARLPVADKHPQRRHGGPSAGPTCLDITSQ